MSKQTVIVVGSSPPERSACCLTSKPCKVVYKYLEDGTKVRVSKRSGCVVPKPPNLAERQDFKSRSGYIGMDNVAAFFLNSLCILV